MWLPEGFMYVGIVPAPQVNYLHTEYFLVKVVHAMLINYIEYGLFFSIYFTRTNSEFVPRCRDGGLRSGSWRFGIS